MPDSAYVIELDRWGVNNNGLEAVNTTKGINDALVWASQQGFKEVVLPKGTYLIDEKNPIAPQSFMTFNLNGSTLKIRTNNSEIYRVIRVYQKNFSRITNGIIVGDKGTHDYYNGAAKWKPNTTYSINDKVIPTNTIADSSRYYYMCTAIATGVSGTVEPSWNPSSVTLDGGIKWTAVARGTHEGGTGININGGKFITVDNLEIYNLTGDAVNCGGDGGTLPYYLRFSTSSVGGLSPIDGTPTNETNKIRWTTKIPMDDPVISKFGTFGIYGNGYGYLGSEITATHYDVLFYNKDDIFHSSRTKVQFFDDVEVPDGASYAKIVLYQNTIPSDQGNQLWVAVNRNCQHIYFEKLNLHHCRRQGMSLGGKFIYVRDNEIHHIKGTNPQSGIDIEDGYNLNQHYYIERNHFHDNHGYDLVITSGKYMNVSNNRFNSAPGYISISLNQPIHKSVFIGNIIHQAQAVIAGEFIISDNHFFGSNIAIGDKNSESKEILIANSLFHNSQLTVNQTTAYKVQIDGCKFLNDSNKRNIFGFTITLALYNTPQIFSNCLFEGKDTNYFIYFASGDNGGWIFDDSIFINTSSGLANGTYHNCKFVNPPYNSFSTANKEVEFINCNFTTDSSYDTNVPFFTATNGIKAFRLMNSSITHYGGNLLRVQNTSGDIVVKGNTFDFTGNKENKSVITVDSTFAGNMMIENNYMSSLNKREALQNWAPQSKIIIRNNVLKNTALNVKDKEIKQNNWVDATMDPYYNMPGLQASGYYVLGQEVKNSNPVPGGYWGWVCVVQGYASNNSWSPSKIYSLGERIQVNGHVYESQTSAGQSSITMPSFPADASNGQTILDTNGATTWKPNQAYAVGNLVIPQSFNGYYYRCTVAGTSGAAEPKWPTLIGGTVNDGTVTWTTVRPIIVWKEIGAAALFKKFGNIEA